MINDIAFRNITKEVNNELLKKGMGYLDKAGETIAQYGQTAITKAGEGLNWLKGKGQEIIAKIKPEQLAE